MSAILRSTASPCRFRRARFRRAWPFGNTESAWNDTFLNWVKGIVVDGEPQASANCSLAACHGGQDPDSPLPFIGTDSVEYADSIASLYPYFAQESAYDGNEYSGRLWRHIDNSLGEPQYVGLGGFEQPAFTDEDLDFLKSIIQRAWACEGRASARGAGRLHRRKWSVDLRCGSRLRTAAGPGTRSGRGHRGRRAAAAALLLPGRAGSRSARHHDVCSMRISAMRLRTLCLTLGFTLLGAPQFASTADAAPKCKGGKRPEVFVRPKTPIRRGPGLNYQVSRFLEKGRCLPFSEVSMDQNWVLIDHAAALGWVPVSRLSKRSQERVSRVQPKAAPVGSAQVRGAARVRQQAMLLEEPAADAKPRRVLVKDVVVVPLAMTDDGRWVQVRDERGDVGWVLMSNLSGDALAGLPVLSDGFNRGVAANEEELSEDSRKALRAEATPDEPKEAPSGPISASRATTSSSFAASDLDAEARSALEPSDTGPSDLIGTPARESQGLGITASVLAGAVVPNQQLDSNAELGRRRYDLSAFAPAVALQLELTDVGAAFDPRELSVRPSARRGAGWSGCSRHGPAASRDASHRAADGGGPAPAHARGGLQLWVVRLR